VELEPATIAAIKKLTQKHLEQDKRELHGHNQDGETNVDMVDNLSSSINASNEGDSLDVLFGISSGEKMYPYWRNI
jgi:hypothetical protein